MFQNCVMKQLILSAASNLPRLQAMESCQTFAILGTLNENTNETVYPSARWR